ncbi:hypothetical protein B0H19DRAFT_934049 [Mycena capillaripes]|nr:hypothetical protein B0H19DRAFT_934049 [Mycena capillaripes]
MCWPARWTDVNLQGGRYGSVLQAASFNRHKDIVQLLIEQGADRIVQGGHHGTRLQADVVESDEGALEVDSDGDSA